MQEDRISQDQPCAQAGQTEREDAKAQARVLSLVLSEQPRQLSRAEVERELLGEQPEFAEQDELARAIRDLGLTGLLHVIEELVLPTRAALAYYRLELE